MEVKRIYENKKQCLDLLFLADEQESMKDKYMDNESIRIISVRDNPDHLERAVDYLASKWKVPRNIYLDCIKNSLTTASHLPRWYLMQKDVRSSEATG